jgi:hypothetical protein
MPLVRSQAPAGPVAGVGHLVVQGSERLVRGRRGAGDRPGRVPGCRPPLTCDLDHKYQWSYQWGLNEEFGG